MTRVAGRLSARVALPPLTAQAALDAVRRHDVVDAAGRWAIETTGGLLILRGSGVVPRPTAAHPYLVVPGTIVALRRRFARPIEVELVLDVWSKRACELVIVPVTARPLRSGTMRGRRYERVARAVLDRLALELAHWALHDPVLEPVLH
jgi:hypothetical protein